MVLGAFVGAQRYHISQWLRLVVEGDYLGAMGLFSGATQALMRSYDHSPAHKYPNAGILFRVCTGKPGNPTEQYTIP